MFKDLRVGSRVIASILIFTIAFSSNCQALALTPPKPAQSYESMQAADILGIRDEVNHLIAYKKQAKPSELESNEILATRIKVLRKILIGALDVRKTYNKIDLELAYTYSIMQREQRKENAVNQVFNLINFLQFGITYALEGRSRIHNQFTQSSVLTCVSAGLTLGLPTMNILYSKFAKARDTAPPKFLSDLIEGGPVNPNNLPKYTTMYLNSAAPGSTTTRKEELYSWWQNQFHVDPTNEGSLLSLTDGKGKSVNNLNTRICLLWSLRTFVSGFDKELNALSKEVQSNTPPPPSTTINVKEANLSPGAAEVAKLLNIEPQVAELIQLNKTNANPDRRLRLEAFVLEQAISNGFDIRITVNRIYEDLNYSYDVALSQLLNQRGKWLQKNFELNFIKTGTLGAIAGLLYLKGASFAGDQLFLISGAVGTGQSTLTLLLMHGGWKKMGPPNSLADLFDLNPSEEYKLSPLISRYLNSPDPDSKTGKTRKDELYEGWKKRHVTTMNVDSKKNKERLASMPPAKWDTIKILLNRIAVLQSLRVKLEPLAGEFLELLRATDPPTKITRIGAPSSDDNDLALPKQAKVAAEVLDLQSEIANVNHLKKTAPDSDTRLITSRLAIIRAIHEAQLEVRATSANLSYEIVHETQTLDSMTRGRDKVVALTNNANFYQIGILGMITDGPLSQTTSSHRILYGNRLTIIEGLLTIGFASAAFVEQVGGIRLSKAEPNMLGACFGFDSKANDKYYPLLTKFLNSKDPDSASNMTRKEELIEYWKKGRILNLKVSRKSTAQRLSATGKSHHFWNEDMRLLRNRVTMLYGLQAFVDLMDITLLELLETVE